MTNVVLRYRDVLMALGVSQYYGVQLGKLQLQKFIYLSDILSLLWEYLAVDKGHETFRHGPYDYNIQNAVDILSFRGFVNITEFEIQKDGGIRAKYLLSSMGSKLLDKLCENSNIYARYKIYKEIGKQVNFRGWYKLRSIVYAEPTFVNLSLNGWNSRIQTDSILSNLSIQLIYSFIRISESFEKKLTQENLVALYFQVLDQYMEYKSTNSNEDGEE